MICSFSELYDTFLPFRRLLHFFFSAAASYRCFGRTYKLRISDWPKRAISSGTNVVIYALGAMGIISAIILKRMGAGSIVCVDNNSLRLEKAKATGLFEAVIPNDMNSINIIKDICGKNGADTVIEATGASSVLVDAINVTRPGGRIVVGSVYHSSISSFDPLPIFRKEITIVGAKGPSVHKDAKRESVTMQLLVQIKVDLAKIIQVYKYNDALKAFEDAQTGRAIKAVITFCILRKPAAGFAAQNGRIAAKTAVGYIHEYS